MTDPPRPRWKTTLARIERVVVIVLLAYVAGRLLPQIGALVGVGRKPDVAPSFELVTLDGDTLRSADLAGHVVVVNFWATWCPPCRLEMPSLQALHERRAPDGVVVIGISTDAGDVPAVRAFLEERGITYTVGRSSGELVRVFGGIPGIPTTFVLDTQGRVRHRVVGYFAPPALNAAVSRLLTERASAEP